MAERNNFLFLHHIMRDLGYTQNRRFIWKSEKGKKNSRHNRFRIWFCLILRLDDETILYVLSIFNWKLMQYCRNGLITMYMFYVLGL